MKKITLVIVDDHRLIREMLVKLFSGIPEMDILGEGGTFDEAISLVEQKRPDVVLLDINLSNESGFDAVPIMRKQSPGTKIIVVSMHNQPSYVKKMLRLGASGYITKNSPKEEMLLAIEEVIKGNIYICTEIKDIFSESLVTEDTTENKIRDLSVRELEIMRLMKKGQSSKEISAELHISNRTVEVHRYNILKKLNQKNIASLVNFINNSDLNFM